MYYLTNNQFHSIFNSGYRPEVRLEVTKQYIEENNFSSILKEDIKRRC